MVFKVKALVYRFKSFVICVSRVSKIGFEKIMEITCFPQYPWSAEEEKQEQDIPFHGVE